MFYFIICFSIFNSIKIASEFCLNVRESCEYQEINLVGHSWGGLISLNILRMQPEINFKRVVLLSPMTALPSNDDVLPILEEYGKIRNLHGANFEVKSIFEEFKNHRDLFNPILFTDFFKSHNYSIKIIQALNDITVPAVINKKFSEFSGISEYVEVEDNHWFTKRTQLFEVVTKIWK